MNEMNEQVPKKKNNILLILLLIVLFTGIGVGVGFYVGKSKTKDNNEIKEESKQEESPKSEEEKSNGEKEEEPKQEPVEEPEQPAPKEIKADYVIEDNTGKKFYIRIEKSTIDYENFSRTTTYYKILNDQEEEIDKIKVSIDDSTVYLAVDTKEDTLGRKYVVGLTFEDGSSFEEFAGKYVLYTNGNGEIVNNSIFYLERTDKCTYMDYKVTIENGKVVKKALKEYSGLDHIYEIGAAC